MKHLRFENFIHYVLISFLILSIGCDRTRPGVEMLMGHDVTAELSLRVSMVYPAPCLGDMAYCDLLAAGVDKAAADLDIDIQEIESGPGSWQTDLRQAAETSDLVITAGYQMAVPLDEVAAEFPSVRFAIIDSEIRRANVASYLYNVHEGSFLVGAIAGLKTQTQKVGYIGGADVPLLHQFEAGYLAGVLAVNPEAVVIREYIAKGPEGFSQPDVAKHLAEAQYESGVDIIYTAAAGAGLGAVEAAKAFGTYVIWVDTNINATAPDIFLTSMVKREDITVYNIISEFATGNFTAGIHHLSLSSEGIGYALDTHNAPHLSEAILMRVEALKAAIISGEIQVPREPTSPRNTDG